jgi:putative hemolysin
MTEGMEAAKSGPSAMQKLKGLPRPGAYAVMAILALLVVGSAFVVYQNANERFGKSGQAQEDRSAAPGATGLANPAAVYCEGIGGTTRNVDTPQGQTGMCDLPDGSTCDEWTLFNSNSTRC